MRVLEDHSCAEYLRAVGLVDGDEHVTVRQLAGGVSNVVFHVARGKGRGDDFVLKQAREQLQVEQPWFCSVERIWREVDVLRICNDVLCRTDLQSVESVVVQDGLQNRPPSLVPKVLFEDRENYVFAMTAAPAAHRTWKEMLLAREFSNQIASACGELLGRLHSGTWNDAELAERIGDRQYFVNLRVDPYFRRVAEFHADLRPVIDELIESLESNPHCLVHGDFSPKNLLVWNEPQQQSLPTIMLIDCEVGHFGDPAFDLGFFLTHLTLKGLFHGDRGDASCMIDSCEAFWAAYANILGPAISSNELDVLQQRAVLNWAGCLLARVDGKSPVEYLARDDQRQFVRRLARELFSRSPSLLDEGIAVASQRLNDECASKH